jgi:hypothetical protein
MKKLTLFAFVAICSVSLLGLASCGGQKQGDVASGVGEATATPEPLAKAPDGMQEGYILRDDTWYTSMSTSDAGVQTLSYVKKLDIGDVVYFDNASQITMAAKGETTQQIWVKFVRKANPDDKGYVPSNYIGFDGARAIIVKDKASIYKSPEVIARDTKKTLPILQVGTVQSIPGGDGKFMKFYYFDKDYWKIMSVFVMKDSVSTDDATIESGRLAIKAKKITGGDKASLDSKKQYLQDAVSNYSGSVLIDYIQTQLTNIDSAGEPETVVYSATFRVTAESANVYASADASSAVVQALAKGQNVTSEKKEKTDSEADGRSGRWIKISSPVSGWVFSPDFEDAGAPDNSGGAGSSEDYGTVTDGDGGQ